MLLNWNDFNLALRQIALIDLSIAKAAAERDDAILTATTTYNSTTAPLLAKREALAEQMELFYRAHRKEVEAEGKRSIELDFGRAGMRKGNPKLCCLKGWNWERVLQAIKNRFAKKPDRLEQFVITKESVNKDAVKSAGLSEDELAQLGLKVRQKDEFYFETFPEAVQEAA
ncbi:MAG: host-nuclease inhibitor Gam family protein [bacterium]